VCVCVCRLGPMARVVFFHSMYLGRPKQSYLASA